MARKKANKSSDTDKLTIGIWASKVPTDVQAIAHGNFPGQVAEDKRAKPDKSTPLKLKKPKDMP